MSFADGSNWKIESSNSRPLAHQEYTYCTVQVIETLSCLVFKIHASLNVCVEQFSRRSHSEIRLRNLAAAGDITLQLQAQVLR